MFWRGITGIDEAARRLDDELGRLEERAAGAAPAQRGALFRQAADLCAAHAGREKLTVSYYGKAIDGYVVAGMHEAAGVVCRKLIRFSPDVVRAHFTLAALALLDERVGDAAGEITRYVHAAARTRTQRLAIPRLRTLGHTTADPHLRGVIARSLAWLGDGEGAAQVQRGAPSVPAAERGTRLAELVTIDPHELWERAWLDSPAPADGRRHITGEFALREDLPPPLPHPGAA